MQISTSIRRLALIGATFAFALHGAAWAEGTLERIQREHKIIIGISNGAPWGYRDASGAATGFHPDLVKAAFSGLGVEHLDVVVTEFGALIPGLAAGRFDAVAAGLYITPERCKLVAFSDPDLTLADAAIVPKGNPRNLHSYSDIVKNGAVMFGAGRGSVTATNAAAAGIPKDRTMLFPDVQANISALISGRIDVAVFSAPTVIKILSDPNTAALERAMPFEGLVTESGDKPGYSAIAFRKSDSELRDAYNKRLALLKTDGTLSTIMAKYGFTKQETAPAITQAQACNADLPTAGK